MSQNGKEYVLLDPTINIAGFTREPGKDMLMCSVFEDNYQANQAPQQQQQHQAPPPQPAPVYNQAQPQQQAQQQTAPNGSPIVYDDNAMPF